MSIQLGQEWDEITLVNGPTEVTPLPERRGRGWEILCVHLTKNTTLQGHPFRARTEVYYSRQKRLISAILSEDTQLQGSSFPAASIVHFYRDSCIEWVSLSKATWIVPQESELAALKATRSVHYYRNGNIKETTLADETCLQGYTLPAETVVHLSSDGQLVWAQLSQEVTVVSAGFSLVAARHSCIGFYRNGTINNITLAEGTLIVDYAFEKDSVLQFDFQGRLISAEVYSDRARAKFFSHRDTRIRFNEDTSIREIEQHPPVLSSLRPSA